MSNAQLPGSVRLDAGPGASPVLHVHGPQGWAEIHLHGAHVTAWGPAGQPSALWLSPLSGYGAGAAIRGGIPLCFPWFGPLEGRPDQPRHGVGRTALWALDDVQETADDVVVQLTMSDGTGTLSEAWPHPFEARCTVRVGARLTVDLEFTHHGAEPASLEVALHTYLAVPDVTAVEITGLESASFLDKTAAGTAVPATHGPLRIGMEVDRVYLDTTSPVRVRDEAGGVDVTVEKRGSTETVVWNPWADRARSMDDIGDGDWPAFVCVEACAIGAGAVRLTPGRSHRISTTISTADTLVDGAGPLPA